MSEWIPKTGDFADAWRSRTDGEHSWASAEESRESDAQFDRWLASVKADAWRLGFYKGMVGNIDPNPYEGVDDE
jgi:hypothetical protein